MPTYDYECSQCHHQWEVFQSITAKPLRKCPECGKLKAKRIIGAGGGIIFKGSGFLRNGLPQQFLQKSSCSRLKSTVRQFRIQKFQQRLRILFQEWFQGFLITFEI